MAYRIEYDAVGGKYEVSKDPSRPIPKFLPVAVSLFVLGMVHFWPEGAEKLRQWMIPGEDAVTVQAFQTMTENLRKGIPVGEAVEAFCRYVIYGT